jgi:hypothetical protein
MQSYILILLGVLVVLLIGVIYFGWRRILNLEIENNKNKYDIEALRGLLNKMLSDGGGEEFNVGPSVQFQEAEILKMMQQQQQQQQQYFQKQKMQVMEDESEDETLESSDEDDDEIPDDDEESTVSIEDGEEDDEEDDEEEEDDEDEEDEDDDEDEDEIDEDELDALLKQELGIKDESSEIPVEESVKEKTIEDLPKEDIKLETEAEKEGKKVPNQMAKLFKTGHRLKSENDGNMYEVIGSGNSKKWKLVD